MIIRLMKETDREEVRRLMQALWPDENIPNEFDDHVFVAEEGGNLKGFASFSVRPWVEGTKSEPCPHVEGWYVEPDYRRQGVGRALIIAIEDWAREKGFKELTSDIEMENKISFTAHRALGFEPTTVIQYFRKKLS